MFFEDVAISIRGVSVEFAFYEKPRDQLKQLIIPHLSRLLGRQPTVYHKSIQALENINLEIKRGEATGIVGVNGSGKSTLLQAITGVLAPTSGDIFVAGRIAAILELGSGFNPEFTGRENVYLNGALLGLSRTEIEKRFDAIAAFADIGELIEYPVKTYSSGMLVRLAFALQICVDPSILIVDEALAVGDERFQKKCIAQLQKMRDQGVTLLLVSHDSGSLKKLCSKAVLLDKGKLVAHGDVKPVLNQYEFILNSDRLAVASFNHSDKVIPDPSLDAATSAAKLLNFSIKDQNNNITKKIERNRTVKIEYSLQSDKRYDEPAYGLLIRDRFGSAIFEASTYSMRISQDPIGEGDIVTVRYEFDVLLNAGKYFISIGVANKGYGKSEFAELAMLIHDVEILEVLDDDSDYYFGGVFDMKPTVKVEHLVSSL